MNPNNETDSLTAYIKTYIKDQIDKEYTEYKEHCLIDLDNQFEAKRNNIVGQAINRNTGITRERKLFRFTPCYKYTHRDASYY